MKRFIIVKDNGLFINKDIILKDKILIKII